MMLNKLVEYAQRNETADAPKLYAERMLRYVIELGADGQCHGVVPTEMRVPMPYIKRSGPVIRPYLLADRADYTLGIPVDKTTAQHTPNRHAAYMQRVERCAAETGEPDVLAVLRFLKNEPLKQLTLPTDFDSSGIITFRVNGGDHVIDNPAVQRFWASINESDSLTMQCLICGENRPTLERLKSNIKGVPGGSGGADVISANRNAFESYGLQKSQIAPICSECAESFTQNLNSLLSSETKRFRTGNSIFVFWTRGEQDFDSISPISTPNSQHVKAMLESVHKGLWNASDETEFYGLALSASKGRVVVRDWLNTTVRNAKKSLALWFQRQRVAPNLDGESPYYGVTALANATVRERKDLPVTTPRALIKSAFSGEPLPGQILQQAIRRCQAERRVTRPRAALIKLALLSQRADYDHQEDYMVELNQENADPGYLCGRLFAMLERAQTSAIRNVNATIADRYYGTASTAPQAVFPLLLKGARAHFHTLNRDNKGAQVAIETEIERIMSKMDAFPRTLNLEQQGRFALGYYHQRAENGRRARESASRRAARQNGDNEPDAG